MGTIVDRFTRCIVCPEPVVLLRSSRVWVKTPVNHIEATDTLMILWENCRLCRHKSEPPAEHGLF